MERTEQAKRNGAAFRAVMLTTFLVGLVSYGYTLMSFTPSHDSLNEFVLDTRWQLALGRFGFPVYQTVFGMTITTPLTCGLLGLFWLALAACAVVRMFGVTRPIPAALITAVMTANVSVAALAVGYTPFFGPQMLAVALAAGAALCWKLAFEGNWRRGLLLLALGVCLLAASLSLYQAQLAFTLSLIMLFCIRRFLTRGDEAGRTLRDGFIAIGMVLLAGAGYLIAVRMACYLTNVRLTEGDYNSITSLFAPMPLDMRVKKLADCYRLVFEYLWLLPRSVYPEAVQDALFWGLWALLLLGGGMLLCRKKRPLWASLCALALAALMPVGMNVSGLFSGTVHDVMCYACVTPYLALILLMGAPEAAGTWLRRGYRLACGALLAVLLLSQVQTANLAGVSRHAAQQTTLSAMTRVLDRIEQTDGYEPGVTPVAIVGMLPRAVGEANGPIERKLWGMAGMAKTQATGHNTYDDYFTLVLQTPVNLLNYFETVPIAEKQAVKDMPCFPRKGSVENVDGVVVVKFTP